MKPVLILILIFGFSFPSFIQAQDSEMGTENTVTRKICEDVFGAVPNETSFRIKIRSEKAGEMVFIFSLPEQNLIGSLNSGRSSFDKEVGCPSVVVGVLPIYPPEVIEKTKLLNQIADAQDAKAHPDRKGGKTVIKLPHLANQNFSFYISGNSMVAEDPDARLLIIEQMSRLFSGCQVIKSDLTVREFWVAREGNILPGQDLRPRRED